MTLNTDSKKQIADALKPVLAETVQLYYVTQNVHWNVTGPMFHSVHTLTETNYTALAMTVDEIAERIRSLGEKAPGSLKNYVTTGGVEEVSENASATDMVAALVKGNETVANRLRPIIGMAGDAGDEATADLLTGKLADYEKAAWMYGALIE